MAWVNEIAYPIVKSVGCEHMEISGDGDQFRDPGEELQLCISVANLGNETVDSLNLTIECKDERVEFTEKTTQYFDIKSVDTLSNIEKPFIFNVKPNTKQGGNINISLLFQGGSRTWTDSIQFSIGPISVLFIGVC